MHIHLAKSGGDLLPDGRDFRTILAVEQYPNSLLSYAFRGIEPRWKQYWEDLILAVERSKIR